MLCCLLSSKLSIVIKDVLYQGAEDECSNRVHNSSVPRYVVADFLSIYVRAATGGYSDCIESIKCFTVSKT